MKMDGQMTKLYQLLDQDYKEIVSGTIEEISYKIDELQSAERYRQQKEMKEKHNQSSIFDHI